VSGQRHAPAALYPGKDLVPIVQEAGWAPGPVWTDAENIATTGIRSPDRPACSQSLYRLTYTAFVTKAYRVMLCGKAVKVYAQYHILRTTHCVDKRQSSLISQPLVSTQYTVITVHSNHSKQHTLHSNHSTQYTTHINHSTQHTAITVNSTHYTVITVHSTQHTLITVHSTRYTVFKVQCTQHTVHSYHSAQYTVITVRST